MSSDYHHALAQTNVDVESLRTSLKNISLQKDPRISRRVVQNVVATMTLGFDVSSLFTEMVMACATNDLVQKKMVYLYLCTHADSQPDLALLTVSTLCKDAASSNAMVRGLALRSMFNLRLPDLVVHMKTPLMNALHDKSSYVRKTAVVACLKMFYVSKDTFDELELMTRLRECIFDDDAKVVVNAVLCVEEILALEGGVTLDSALVQHLLHRLAEFDRWDQSLVLSLLSRYEPKDPTEIFEILNSVDGLLRSTNSAVILAASRLFLKFAKDEIRDHIFQRLKVPLINIVNSQPPEIIFTALQHVDIIAQLEPSLFADSISSIFVRESDPLYVKRKRLEILTKLITENNIDLILAELRAHACNLRSRLSSTAVQGIGVVAKSLAFCHKALPILIELVQLENGRICGEILLIFKEILVVDEKKSEFILSSIENSWDLLDCSPEGKSAAIWIIARFHKDIPGSAQLIGEMMSDIANETDVVKRHLLLAATRLFWSYPNAMQKKLGELLRYCIEDCTNMDIKDRALFYYRLLKLDPEKAKKIVCAKDQPIELTGFCSEKSLETELRRFNSMAMFCNLVRPHFNETASAIGNTRKSLPDSSMPPEQEVNERKQSIVEVGDLLRSEVAEPLPRHAVMLYDTVSLDSQQFESEWQSTTESTMFDQKLTVCPMPNELIPFFKSRNIHLMASGQQERKRDCYFLYCKEVSRNALLLTQLVVDQFECTSHVILKCHNTSVREEFVEFFKSLFIGKWIAVNS